MTRDVIQNSSSGLKLENVNFCSHGLFSGTKGLNIGPKCSFLRITKRCLAKSVAVETTVCRRHAEKLKRKMLNCDNDSACQ